MFQFACGGCGFSVNYFIISLFFFSQPISSAHCVSHQRDELEYEQTVLAVNRAAKYFQEHVEFSCEFAYRKTELKSWNDAWGCLSDPFANYPAKLSKRGRDICLELGETGDYRNVRLLTFDGISLSINVPFGGFSLLPPPDVDEGFLTLQYNDPLLFSPLFYGGAHKGVLVAPLMEKVPENIDTVNSIIRVGEGKFIVRQELSAAISKGSVVNEQEFHILSGIPTKVREEYKEIGENGEIRLRSVTEMEGFEQCGSVPMATSLKRVLGPVGGKYIAWKWQANTLRKPSEQDFVIEIPDNVSLPDELELGESRQVDSARLRVWAKVMTANQKRYDNSSDRKDDTGRVVASVPGFLKTQVWFSLLAVVVFGSLLFVFTIRLWYLRNRRLGEE